MREELVGLGAPAQDMIDAQSFLWLRRLDARAAPEKDAEPSPSDGQRAWIFQANPEYYALDSALQELDQIEWTIKKHRSEVKPGDRVYMWRSGSQAAIVAVGHIAGATEVRPPSEAERPYSSVRISSPSQSRALTVVVELERPSRTLQLGGHARVLRAVSRFSSTPEELYVELEEHDFAAIESPEQVKADTERERVLKSLKAIGDPATTELVAEELELPKSTVRRHLRTLLERELVARSGSGRKNDAYAWRLTGESEEP